MTTPEKTFQKYLAHDLKMSQLYRLRKALDFSSLLKTGRPLSSQETIQLEQNRNRCSQWKKIRVHKNFTAENIFDCSFSGAVYLATQKQNFKTHKGASVQPGLLRCHIENSAVKNAYLENVSQVRNYIIEDGVYALNISFLTCDGKTNFGLDKAIHPGSETFIRRVWSLETATNEYAHWASCLNLSQQKKIEPLFQKHLKALTFQMGYIGENSFLYHIPAIYNSWVGPNSRIEGAIKVNDSLLSGSNSSPISISDGAKTDSCLLQAGAVVTSGAQTSRCLLQEHSTISENAVVTHSIIGINSHISKGEVTSSLLGPFVASHHQSLLISALWPRGKGNVGHGADIGSNHTGKKPDQEIHIGEGLFFGLSVQLKFPANFKKAPYSLLATGLHAPPQKVCMPFSLIAPLTEEAEPFHALVGKYNQIFPGWIWFSNPYALFRSMYKFEDRNKSSLSIPFSIFTSEISECVWEAYLKLKRLPNHQDFFTNTDLPDLGANILTEAQRQKSLVAYEDFLFFSLLMETNQPGKLKLPLYKKIQSQLFSQKRKDDFLIQKKKRISSLKERMFSALERDEKKGLSIIEDYSDFYPSIRKNPNTDLVMKRFLKEIKSW